MIRPDGTEERLCHDAEGRLLAHTDAMERSTSYRYGLTGLITQRIDANGHRLQYEWDKLGRLAELRNENGVPYTFAYDPAGRLLKEVGFDGKATEYAYDSGSGVLAEVSEECPTIGERLRAAGLPMTGTYRFIPEKGYNPCYRDFPPRQELFVEVIGRFFLKSGIPHPVQDHRAYRSGHR